MPTISVLTSRVRNPNHQDLEKLVRCCKYLNSTKEIYLKLKQNDMNVLKIYVDAAYGVHDDCRSHSGLVAKFGQGSALFASRKQRLNTRSSTEAELVAVDDFIGMVLWTNNFLEAQGYGIGKNILYQDNRSAMLLEENGRASAGKRSKHLNVRYFFVKDVIDAGKLDVAHSPTEEMIGDFMTKPLQGSKFKEFRISLLGM